MLMLLQVPLHGNSPEAMQKPAEKGSKNTVKQDRIDDLCTLNSCILPPSVASTYLTLPWSSLFL